MEIKERCSIIIAKLREKYLNVSFGYEYDPEIDIHHIWYNSINLKDDISFVEFISDNLESEFYTNDIYNVFVAYFYKYDESTLMKRYVNWYASLSMMYKNQDCNNWLLTTIENDASSFLNYKAIIRNKVNHSYDKKWSDVSPFVIESLKAILVSNTKNDDSALYELKDVSSCIAITGREDSVINNQLSQDKMQLEAA